MDNKEILRIAMAQSAADLSCEATDFQRPSYHIVESKANPAARKYLELPFYLQMVSYGNEIVASVASEARQIAESYLGRYPAEHCFETPNLHVLDDMLRERGYRVCFMAEYFLPDLNLLKPLSCGYEIRLLEPEEWQNAYLPEWSNALCEERKELDVLVAAAFDGDRMIGMAGCSADCDTMWQIGIDVLPDYRRRGVASALTSRLALETLERGKVPFYCAAWCNIRSVRNAIRCGFRPAWAEMTAKKEEFIRKMNQEK